MRKKVAVCFLLLAYIACANAQPDPLKRINDVLGISSGGLNLNAVVGPASASARSCGGASVTVRGPGGASASSSSRANVFLGPAKVCAKSVYKALVDFDDSTKCVANLENFIYVSARACARTSMELRVKSAAEAKSWGRGSVATAWSCSDATGHSSAYTSAITEALAAGMIDAGGKQCGIFAAGSANATVRAVASVMTDAFTSSWAYASTVGNGNARAVATALWQSDVETFARVIARFLGVACGGGCRTRCNWCQLYDNGVAIKLNDPFAADDSFSTVVGATAQGRYAIATAWSNAAAGLCNGISAKVTAEALLKSFVSARIDVVARAFGKVTAQGKGSVACSGSNSTGRVDLVALATADMAYDAVVLAFMLDGTDNCTVAAYTQIAGMLVNEITMHEIFTAEKELCVRSKGAVVTWRDVENLCIKKRPSLFSTAFVEVIENYAGDNRCKCAGAGWCCTDCGKASRHARCPF